MSPVSRRIFLYWMLLLVPTLAVGAGAILLLRREQARIVEQSARAQESLRSAAEARAKLIVENAELLAGDVQTLLLDTLAEQPAGDLDVFLEDWSRTNPLVRAAFRAQANGEVIWPRAGASDEKSRGFLQRFSATLRSAPPWKSEKKDFVTLQAPAPQTQAMPTESYALLQEATENARQVQFTRQNVQQMLRSSADASNTFTFNNKVSLADSVAAEASKAAPLVSASAPSQASSASPAPQAARPAPKLVERREWSTIQAAGGAYVLGWIERGGEVRGVEVDTLALVERLKEAMPTGSSEGEFYELQGPVGVGRKLLFTRSEAEPPTLRVPLATALLPGWSVVVHLPDTYEARGGFVGAGVVLVALLVIAILAGGSLLLWQARSSMEEAAQKTSFVANVSHEFKTPLTTIRLYSELLEQGRVRSEEQGREYLRTIGRETQRLARLVNNALDFSRLEQGKKKYVRETLDLRDELGRLFQTHALRLAEAGLTLNWQLPPEPVSAVVDRDALEQIVLNLLDNACKYAAEGREVAVALEARPGGGALVRVADRGPGVPSEQRERIFEKFHRVDESLTAEKTGTGLGLSIARQLARGLGGELRCEPREGGGAEFILTLA